MLCDFTKISETKRQCKRCKQIVTTAVLPDRIVARCKIKDKTQPPPSPTPEQKTEAQRQAWLAENGCGAHLHRIIQKYTGEGITSDCQCRGRIAKMNRNGPAWCRENLDKIVGWLIEEADRRLKQDEGKSASWRLRLGGFNLPGRRLVLRRLVLVAVRRAERDDKSQPKPLGPLK